jgi:ADP-heptose:LPS heptosyltransferase
MDILVINLMRLGDLIQTTPVLRCLRAQYPEGRITLAVKDLFQEAAGLLPGVDRLLAFPSVDLAMFLDQEGGWPAAAQRLEGWLRQNFSRPPDLVINLTPNALGGVLAYATGSREMRGMTAYQTWELGTRPDWASYALVVSRARSANPFNLVDLFLREGGLIPDGLGLEAKVPPAAEEEAAGFLRGLNVSPGTKLVGLFPGASQMVRMWPPERFVQASQRILQRHACHFFLFGSAKEAALGEAVARQLPAGAATSLLGRTTPAGLTAYLKRLDLLITNDTGPMHLAAAVGTPILALFLASARVQDTGPAGRGHIIIEPRLDCHPCLAPCPQPRCHQAITPEAVAFWADKVLSGEHLVPLDEASVHRPVRVYWSTIDPHGYHAYLPLVRRPLGSRDFWLWLHRAVWGQVLDGSSFAYAPLREWLKSMILRHFLPPREDPGLAAGEGCLAELSETAGRGEQLAQEILILANNGGQSPVRLLQKIEALGGVDQALRRMGVACPHLAAFVDFFFLDQRDKQGTEVILLARELKSAYGRLRRLGEVARACLPEFKMILEAGKGENSAKMAQTVQCLLTNRESLPPESEGLSCR